MNAQFKKGALELCVLSQLALRDQYGYELTENISKEMKLAAGTLYLILKRLRDEEYVETYLVEAGEVLSPHGEGLGLSGTVKERMV